MAVALRGFAPLSWQASGPLSWPLGTVKDDLAIVWSGNPDSGPDGSDWKFLIYNNWWKVLTAADITNGPGSVAGRFRGLLVLSGARACGATTFRRGVTVSEAGGAALIEAWTPHWPDVTTLNPVDSRLGAPIKGHKDEILAWWLLLGTTTGYKSIANDPNAESYYGIEVLPLKAPVAPTLITPSADQDNTAPITLQWVHNSSSALPQDAWRMQIRPVGSQTWQYVTAAGGLQGTLVDNPGSTQGVSLPVGRLTNVAWQYQVATSDSGQWSPWSLMGTVTPAPPPTATPVLTAAAGNLAVGINWIPTTPGGQQTAWQVAVAPAGAGAAAAVWQTVVTPGASTMTVTPALTTWVNGGSYQAWLRIQQTGGIWSAWTASTPKTVSWTPPAAPGAVVVRDDSPLIIDISGISAISESLEVQSSPDGIEWSLVAGVSLPNQTEHIANPLAAYGQPLIYRARLFAPISGALLPSAWIEAGPIASTDMQAYLVDPDTGMWLAITTISDDSRSVQQGVSVTYGLDSTAARTDRTPTAGERGSTTILAKSAADRAAYITWLTSRDTWWLRWTPEVDEDNQTHPQAATLMALADKVTFERVAQVNVTYRFLTFSWVEVH